MPVSVQIILVISAIAGLAYTVGKALSSVQKEDLAKLEKSIDEVKSSQKANADKLEAKIDSGIAEVKNIQREDANKLATTQKEIADKFEANQKQTADKLEGKIETSISALNAKFDRYLFGKLEKTKPDDDSPDSPPK